MTDVTYEFDGSLAVVTIVHAGPPVLSRPLMEQLHAAISRARDEQARGLLLRAKGPVFLAGADAADFKDLSATAAREMFGGFIAVVHLIESLEVPTVASVHGMCLGGGLELALACDLIVACKGTTLGQVEARLGGATFLGGTSRLAQRCGSSRALQITYSAGMYDADTFADWNIVTNVWDSDNFNRKSLELAAALANGPTAAHRVSKRVLRTSLTDDVATADTVLMQLAPDLLETADMQAAVDAMLTMGTRDFMASSSPVAFRGR